MTFLLSFLARAWPFIACLALGAVAGGYLEKNRWEARYDALQASTEKGLADAQQAANQALQIQIQRRLTTEASNGQIISQLAQERDSAVSSRLVAERLLATAQARPSAGHSVSAAPDRPGTPDPAPDAGDRPPALDIGITADAIADCRDAVQRLSALQGEVMGQLAR